MRFPDDLLVSTYSYCCSLQSWAATSYKSLSESSSEQGHVSSGFGSFSVDKGTPIWYKSLSDGSNPWM